MNKLTSNEKGLIEWLLTNEISRCEDKISQEKGTVWEESYQKRVDCAKSLLEKVKKNAITSQT